MFGEIADPSGYLQTSNLTEHNFAEKQICTVPPGPSSDASFKGVKGCTTKQLGEGVALKEENAVFNLDLEVGI